MLQTPIPDSYWLRPGRLLAGEYPGAKDEAEARRKLRTFLDAGVTCFLDLTEATEGLRPYAPLLTEETQRLARTIRYQRFPIPDFGVPSVELMREILQFIAAALAEDHIVYVHCWGGIGRTGTVAGCYLVEQGLTPETALAEIARLRFGTPDGHRTSPETGAQRTFIHEWPRSGRPAPPAAPTGASSSHSTDQPATVAAPGHARRTWEHFAGCLLGGAVGDALGAAVEFDSLAAIRQQYGPAGIQDYDLAYGRRGAITDDTQMTLFTAEGVLRALTRSHRKGVCHPPSVLHHAYLRWLHTQGERSRFPHPPEVLHSWLLGVAELHHRRAPGNTCLSALRQAELGTLAQPLNNSKGCGGVMRVAPIGLVADTAEQAFQLGNEAAALTHGHPSGYYSAGCFAAIIFHLVAGRSLPEAIEFSLRQLERPENGQHEECAAAIRQALGLWRAATRPPTPELIEQLGGGWVGEEALAISLYCALAAQEDFARGVRLAVNHSGDSDSTGAITGNLLGLMLGVAAISPSWLAELELRSVIETLAGDLLKRYEETDTWWERYPGA